MGLQEYRNVCRVMLPICVQSKDGAASAAQGVGKTQAKGITLPAVGRDGDNFNGPTVGHFASSVGGPIVHDDYSAQILFCPVDDFADGTFSVKSRDDRTDMFLVHDYFLALDKMGITC
jgi:hypothetical protein